MELEEMKKTVEDGMKAFETVKTDILPLKQKFEEMDADSQTKFKKLEESIANAMEHNQKAEAKAKADEEARKTLATELDELKTAFNRVPTGHGDAESKATEIAELRKSTFNEFARKGSRQSYGEFLANLEAEKPEVKALSVGTDPNGGYLVLPEFGGILKNREFETSPIRMLATVTPIGSDALEIVQDNDEATCGWASETGTRSETDTPNLGKLYFPAEELYAKPKATQKMLEDGSVDIEAWLMEKVADAFARKEATAFVNGDGVGKPKGLLQYTAGTSVTSHQVEQVNSANATGMTYDGLVNLQNALKESYQPNAVFLFRRATLSNVLLIKDGEGRPIFNMDYNRNAGQPPATLMGKPVYFAADVPAVGAAALAAIYGDIRQAYQIVDRRGIQVLRDPYSSKPYVEFYTTKRVGGGVKNFEAIKIQKIAN